MADYTEIEHRILDMWPKYEDGEYVMPGDEWLYLGNPAKENTVSYVTLDRGGATLRSDIREQYIAFGERVKRPAPKVLDADGVEINVGDTVYAPGMFGDTSFTVSRFGEDCCGDAIVMVEETYIGLPLSYVTHTRPDSWERLEQDARNSICGYFGKGMSECDGCPANAIAANSDEFECCDRAVKLDIVRRAKALAEKEVGDSDDRDRA